MQKHDKTMHKRVLD